MLRVSNQSAVGIPASLVEVWRGPIVESRHRGHLIAVDGNGNVVAALGTPTETYDDAANPVQQAIAKTISQFADVPIDSMAFGVDGCGVPVFGIPVRAMALMYARLVTPPDTLDAVTRRACKRIVQAMID